MFGKNCFNCSDTMKFLWFPQVCIFGDVIYDVSTIFTKPFPFNRIQYWFCCASLTFSEEHSFWLPLHWIIFLLQEKTNDELIRIFKKKQKVSCIGDLSIQECKYQIYQHQKMEDNSDGCETIVNNR